MTSDGHDTSVTVAGAWTRSFLEPLLNNKNFMQNTLVLVTFDETHTYTIGKITFGLILVLNTYTWNRQQSTWNRPWRCCSCKPPQQH